MSAREGWNTISRSYQEKTRISLEDVHYGPISLGESELKLLGDVKSKDILEIGCGGGQNTIVLAKWGARSTGLDISEEQLNCARSLARKQRVKVQFHLGNMEDLGIFGNASFDIVLSAFGVGYVEDLERTSREVFRVLRNEGLFVFCDVHPVADRGRIVGHGKRKAWQLGNYFDRRKRLWAWRFGKTVAHFHGRHRTIQDYFDALVEAGFMVERILEPEPYHLEKMSEAEKDRMPYSGEGERNLKGYDVWRKTPFTIIFKTRKP
jgi:ubiquinone/menaquinone biosynthesis C-methylase UbiE